MLSLSQEQKTSGIRQLPVTDTQSKIRVYQLILQWPVNTNNLLYQH